MKEQLQLPMFVYGTLRPGQGNTWAWDNMAEAKYDGDCYAQGFRLVSNGSFPYMLPAITSRSIGTLIYPYPECYDKVLDNMDALEGVPVHYQRREVGVMCMDEDGASVVWAYTYIPARAASYADYTEVPDNDWTNHKYRRHPSWQR